MSGLSVRWITGSEEFQALEKDWDDLLSRSDGASPFLSFEWLWTWWEQFGSRHPLRILLVQRGERIVALAPLMLSRLEGLRHLSFIGGKLADYKDLLVDAAEDPDAIVQTALAALEQLPGWDVCLANGWPEDSPQLGALRLALGERAPWRSLVEPRGVAPRVIVDCGWEDRWRRLGGTFRSVVKRGMGRLEKEDRAFRFELDAAPGEIPALIERLAELHVAHWKTARGQYSGFEDPAMLRFYQTLAQRFAARGWLRIPTLRIDGEVAALQLAFEHGQRFYYFIPAYDARHARYSPGHLLNCEVLRDVFARGLCEFDLLAGDEPYKLQLDPQLRRLHFVALFAPGIRGRLARTWILRLRPHLESLRSSPLSRLYFWYRGRMMRRA